MLSDPLTFPPDPARRLATDNHTRVYPRGFLVQVSTGDIYAGNADVVQLQPAQVELSATRVIARVGEVEWSWLLADLVDVFHGGAEPWTILAVPGVADHGVSLNRNDVADFRAALGRALPPKTRIHATSVWSAPYATPSVLPFRDGSDGHDGPASAGAQSWSIVDTGPIEKIGPSTPPPPPSGPPVMIEAGSPRAGDEHRSSPLRSPGPATIPLQASSALAALQARAISAWFSGRQVLDQVSLDMQPGQVTALIGPSGCGKSTFLRILNRMHELIPGAAMAGEVLLDGADVYDPTRKVTDARREIGMVFQKPNPFPTMSIYDNVVASFKLTGRKAGSDEKDEVVESCLRRAGLWNEVKDRLRQAGGGLSGGQQQRLCIARALAIRPRVLLMDEPCSALDPTSTRRIEETICELRAEVTIVIVTHNMQQAARVSDQCAFFLAEQGTPGAIVEHGPTAAMFGSPQDPRTSDYVNGRFG